MSKTGTEDARVFAHWGRDRFLDGRARDALRQPVLDPTLLQNECDHANLNATGTRCLSCGVWAHELVVLVPATSLMK